MGERSIRHLRPAPRRGLSDRPHPHRPVQLLISHCSHAFAIDASRVRERPFAVTAFAMFVDRELAPPVACPSTRRRWRIAPPRNTLNLTDEFAAAVTSD